MAIGTVVNIKEYDHAPGSNLDYGFDWSSWLTAGETIVSSVWTTTDSNVVLANAQVAGGVTSVYVSGISAVGKLSTIVNTITTSLNTKIDSRSLVLSCKHR